MAKSKIDGSIRRSDSNKNGKHEDHNEEVKTEKASAINGKIGSNLVSDCSCCRCSKKSVFHFSSCDKEIFLKAFGYALAICVSILTAVVAIQFVSMRTHMRYPDNVDTDSQCEAGEKNCDVEKQGLTRIIPNKVNETVEIEIEEGRKHIRITKSINPPVFDNECEIIKETAIENGLRPSTLFRAGDIGVEDDIKNSASLKDVDRISNQAWLPYNNRVLRTILGRVGRLTGLPDWIIKKSESLQVVHYDVGGHYHAHLDSTEYVPDKPCCHQATCNPLLTSCCKICRYLTVLFFLNNVEEGGETAFVYADDEKSYKNAYSYESLNLSYNCHNASLVVKPKKGTAILWYNHKRDTKTKFLGKLDNLSLHGGCDIIKGEKWIANTWINAPYYDDRDIPSIFSS